MTGEGVEREDTGTYVRQQGQENMDHPGNSLFFGISSYQARHYLTQLLNQKILIRSPFIRGASTYWMLSGQETDVDIALQINKNKTNMEVCPFNSL